MPGTGFYDPWRAPFEPWPTRGAGASHEGCWHTLHACALGAKKTPRTGFTDLQGGFHTRQKCLQGFFRTFPRPVRSLSNPPNNVARIFVGPCLCSAGFDSNPACLHRACRTPPRSTWRRLTSLHKADKCPPSRHTTPDVHTTAGEPSIQTG